MIKTCPTCGKEFDARSGRAVWCPDCRPLYSAYVPISEWLTIPDAPDYEINGKLVVRNKKTGHVLKGCKKSYGKFLYYALRSPVAPRGAISRTSVALRRQAVDATRPTSFEPIPSLGGKYEVDIKGNVRNARTKKRLKPNCKDVYSMHVGGNKFFFASRNNLLWEVHGIYKKGSAPVGVRAEYKNQRYTFTTCAECARFLLGKLHYSLHTLQCYLWKRKPAFAGWSFTYIEAPTPDIEWDNRGLNRCARRNLKVWRSS